MTIFKLAVKSLCFYWRSNLAVLAAVIVSVAVLAGALAVGDSVENSLKVMADARLGGAEFALIGGERFLVRDFKRKEGFKRAMELARKWVLYRQDYCGCIYSMRRR